MTVSKLKKYIFENNKIEYILKEIGCHNIKYHEKNDYFSAAQPDGDNPMGINIRNNEYLDYRSFSRNVSYDDNEDLISLVEYIKKCSFVDALKYLHNILGLEYKWTKKFNKKNEVLNPVYCLSKHRTRKKINIDEIHVIDEEALNDYVPLLHIDWFREGIMPWSAKKFGLAYSYKRERIIIPMRYWLTGQLLGVNARTTIANCDELGIKKYYITPTYQKNLNLFGLYENMDAILKAGYVVIYEAEKSVLKRDSKNDSTGVALSGHTLSDEQVRILIGLNVDIIIAMDKDVPIEEIRFMCERFKNIRNVFYLYDKWDLLGEKDSPADMPNKIFNFLMKYKVRYNANEHREYLKSLSKKG